MNKVVECCRLIGVWWQLIHDKTTQKSCFRSNFHILNFQIIFQNSIVFFHCLLFYFFQRIKGICRLKELYFCVRPSSPTRYMLNGIIGRMFGRMLVRKLVHLFVKCVIALWYVRERTFLVPWLNMIEIHCYTGVCRQDVTCSTTPDRHSPANLSLFRVMTTHVYSFCFCFQKCNLTAY